MKELNITIRLGSDRVNLSSPEMDCDYWVNRHDLHAQVEALVNEWIGLEEQRTCLECKNAATWTENGQTMWDCKLAESSTSDIEFREEFYPTCLDKGYGPEDMAGLCHHYTQGQAEVLEGDRLAEHVYKHLPSFLKPQAD